MATLTETAYYSRKIINFSIIGLLIFLGLRIIYTTTLALWAFLFPTPPPPANHAFDRIPQISFTQIATPSSKLTVDLQTPDGTLPTLPKTMTVYSLFQPKPSFDSFNRMKSLARQLDFGGAPKKTGDRSWQFTDTATPLRTLQIDEVSLNFVLKYRFEADANLFQERSLTSSDQSYPAQFLSSASLLPDELKSNQKIVYLRNNNGKLVPTTSLSTADVLQISFDHSPINEVPVISPDPDKSLVSVQISPSSNSKKRVIEAQYYYFPIDSEVSGTYEIIRAKAAYDKLVNGSALYAKLPKNSTNIIVRQAYVAYLYPFPEQGYLQPVMVFTDQKDFVAYVPLVTEEWTFKQEAEVSPK